MDILCKCGHAHGNHGIQNGCIFCRCVLSRDDIEIATLRQRLAVAEAALEPFARLADFFDAYPVDDNTQTTYGDNLDNCVTVGQLRTARAASAARAKTEER